jgi:hypothetical protein
MCHLTLHEDERPADDLDDAGEGCHDLRARDADPGEAPGPDLGGEEEKDDSPRAGAAAGRVAG